MTDCNAKCHHEFVVSESALFAGTAGARRCSGCGRVEVLLHNRWIDFDEYLSRRRSDRALPSR